MLVLSWLIKNTEYKIELDLIYYIAKGENNDML